MKKCLFAVLAMVLSTNAFATGGGTGGVPTVSAEQLESTWNGKPGAQKTSAFGVLIHWTADSCGELDGTQFDANKCETKGN